MTKPTVYIVVEGGLVQEVYMHALFGANAEVVICDMDTEDETEFDKAKALIKELPEFAHKVY
jgi:hypothetical protein